MLSGVAKVPCGMLGRQKGGEGRIAWLAWDRAEAKESPLGRAHNSVDRRGTDDGWIETDGFAL